MNNKLNELKILNETLKPPKELCGVFLPKSHEEVFDFMFIAEMPSMNEPVDNKKDFNFNVTARDKFFQNMMAKYGVGGSYVTDIVKERDIPRKPTKEEIQRWLPFLRKEIEIINPKVIIVLGRRTYEASFQPFVEQFIPKEIKLNYVFHYSSQVPKEKFEKRFVKVIKMMRNDE